MTVRKAEIDDGEPLRQWGFVHRPPYAEHTIVGGPCVVLGAEVLDREPGRVEDGDLFV